MKHGDFYIWTLNLIKYRTTVEILGKHYKINQRIGELMTTALGCGLYGPQVAGFVKKIIEHCYTQNIIAPGLMVSEKIFCMGANVPWG